MAASFHTPLPKYYSASRELRNQAEKQRRDKLNHHVSELASLVPFVVRAQRKVDKTSVLRLAASYIRMQKILRSAEAESQYQIPVSLLNEDTSRNLLNTIGGFLLVVTSDGKVVYVSEAIEDSFGYTQADVLGQSIYSLIHQDDKHLVGQQLAPQDSPRRSFYCRLLEKSLSRSDPGRYEIIHVVGQMKPLPSQAVPFNRLENQPSRSPIRRRAISESLRVDTADEEEDNSMDSQNQGEENVPTKTGTHMLIAFVQVVQDRPITELSWVESMRDEYITRHKIDGNIVYVDHRISFVTGLMPEEVVGESAFKYMHRDDVLWSIVAQKQMFGSTQGQGVVTSRLECKNGSYVFLRSRGFLEVNKSTGKVDTFVCINTVLSGTSAEEEVKDQRRSLLPILSGQSQDEVIQSISRDLSPELNELLKCLLRKNSLQNMLMNVENVSSIEDGQILKALTKVSSEDPSNASTSRKEFKISRRQTNPKQKEYVKVSSKEDIVSRDVCPAKKRCVNRNGDTLKSSKKNTEDLSYSPSSSFQVSTLHRMQTRRRKAQQTQKGLEYTQENKTNDYKTSRTPSPCQSSGFTLEQSYETINTSFKEDCHMTSPKLHSSNYSKVSLPPSDVNETLNLLSNTSDKSSMETLSLTLDTCHNLTEETKSSEVHCSPQSFDLATQLQNLNSSYSSVPGTSSDSDVNPVIGILSSPFDGLPNETINHSSISYPDDNSLECWDQYHTSFFNFSDRKFQPDIQSLVVKNRSEYSFQLSPLAQSSISSVSREEACNADQIVKSRLKPFHNNGSSPSGSDSNSCQSTA